VGGVAVVSGTRLVETCVLESGTFVVAGVGTGMSVERTNVSGAKVGVGVASTVESITEDVSMRNVAIDSIFNNEALVWQKIE
jgi:hypothetical protein